MKKIRILRKAVKLIDIAGRNLEGLDGVGASDIIKYYKDTQNHLIY